MIDVYTELNVDEAIIDSIKEAAGGTLLHEKASGNLTVEIVSKDEIRRLNNEFRGIDSVTDVLSFPACDEGGADESGYIGDIAICLDRATEQAKEYGHSLRREIMFLTVHGCLHILGYDHIEKEDERIMFPLQDEILKELSCPR